MNTQPAAADTYRANLAAINLGDHGMLITCPHCQSRALIRTSRAMTALTRDAYCQCTNLACGHTFRAVLEIVETISPSASPVPEIAEKLSPTRHPPPPPRQLPALPPMT